MKKARKPAGAGHGAFDLIDKRRLFTELRVEKSTVLLDLGSGKGDYTLRLAEITGPGGRVYAMDAWEEGLLQLRERASQSGQADIIMTVVADANKGIPLSDKSIDICLMATVLHDLLREETGEVVFREIVRVLKPGGRLAVLEFKKVERGPGPPLRIRLSEKEVESLLLPFGFTTAGISGIGEYHYLLIAELPGPTAETRLEVPEED
jgi:ubiquinone/menaquinone biosynthesis C-methylase UbiE